MIIAVASDGLDVSRHFGHCSGFGCYTVEDGTIVGYQNMPNLQQSSSQAVRLLMKAGIDALIVSRISALSKEELTDAGIVVATGASGNARTAVEGFLEAHPFAESAAAV